MDDEFIYQELKTNSIKLSGIEANVSSLKENVDKMCDWKDDVLGKLQEVNDYMNSRKKLPEKFETLEKDHERLKDKVDRNEELNAKSRKQNEFLMTWYWRISGILLFLTAINFVLVLYGRYIDLTRGV